MGTVRFIQRLGPAVLLHLFTTTAMFLPLAGSNDCWMQICGQPLPDLEELSLRSVHPLTASSEDIQAEIPTGPPEPRGRKRKRRSRSRASALVDAETVGSGGLTSAQRLDPISRTNSEPNIDAATNANARCGPPRKSRRVESVPEGALVRFSRVKAAKDTDTRVSASKGPAKVL